MSRSAVVPLFSTVRTASQVTGASPHVLADIMDDQVNLAVLTRSLDPSIEAFVHHWAQQSGSRLESRVLELDADGNVPAFAALVPELAEVPGHDAFNADVRWLVEAFACLFGARQVGVRIRLLDRPMCPRFHVDHVPVRLITTYLGQGTEWAPSTPVGVYPTVADINDAATARPFQRMGMGDVALLKGEKWVGNEGRAIIHRSPSASVEAPRVVLTLDWVG